MLGEMYETCEKEDIVKMEYDQYAGFLLAYSAYADRYRSSIFHDQCDQQAGGKGYQNFHG
jgi:hypothetical protein